MNSWALVDSNGLVSQLYRGVSRPRPANGIDIPLGVASSDVWWNGTGWAARPDLPAPQVRGTVWTFTQVPFGTSAYVYDIEAGDYLGTVAPDENGDIVIEFAEAGRYRIELVGPAPYRPSYLNLEVV